MAGGGLSLAMGALSVLGFRKATDIITGPIREQIAQTRTQLAQIRS
jgi:hypothetical protein